MKQLLNFKKIWSLHTKLRANEIKYGPDQDETLAAREGLARELLTQRLDGAAEKQYRATLASEQRTKSAYRPVCPYRQLAIAGCLLLQGKKAEAEDLLRSALGDHFSKIRSEQDLLYFDFYLFAFQLARDKRGDAALSLAQFILDQGRAILKDAPVMLRAWENCHQQSLPIIAQASAF